ncbi:MAG: type IV pili methyl-accepting chemotaxis transducer N-terminal domain-containing protein [Gammaproteobacteria bacterium]|nr:type IV pili methyl-accepting chemotaxis transducer N-terminal domain-containing protein [Gammaproteobacteria bacterium]
MSPDQSMPALPAAKSLLLRLAFAMGTITALAFVSMLGSVLFAEAMGGAAGAINHAGTLRFHAYRIAATLAASDTADVELRRRLAADYDARLGSPRLLPMLPLDPADEVRAAYAALTAEWAQRIRSRLLADSPLAPRELLADTEAYVADVDHFVGLLEQRTEAKVRWLRLMHIVTLFLTVTVVVLTMYMMHTRVLVPLRELLACARRTRRGDFSHRTPYETEDELGHLGHAFNAMAEDLSKMYAELEQRVREKTVGLERSNRSLELLYGAAMRLNQDPLSGDSLQPLLRDLEAATGIGPTAICMTAADGHRSYFVAGTARRHAGDGGACMDGQCTGCAPVGAAATGLPADCLRESGHCFAIRDRDQTYGMLLAGTPAQGLEPWQSRLLEAVAAQIGNAITIGRRSEQSRRLALFEERAVIARELHDSLAQSLSYLKIQASRLDAALRDTAAGEVARGVLDELREGISSAYRQLRELLSTFRLRMDGRGLASAVAATVREFHERNHLPIELRYNLDRCSLSPNQEIHVLQVVREALSNVVRHAQASRAAVALAYDAGRDRITVTIDDDGVGIPPSPLRTHHYGLAIMDARARSLGGEVCAIARHGGGTRVEMVFSPSAPAPMASRIPTEASSHG